MSWWASAVFWIPWNTKQSSFRFRQLLWFLKNQSQKTSAFTLIIGTLLILHLIALRKCRSSFYSEATTIWQSHRHQSRKQFIGKTTAPPSLENWHLEPFYTWLDWSFTLFRLGLHGRWKSILMLWTTSLIVRNSICMLRPRTWKLQQNSPTSTTVFAKEWTSCNLHTAGKSSTKLSVQITFNTQITIILRCRLTGF